MKNLTAKEIRTLIYIMDAEIQTLREESMQMEEDEIERELIDNKIDTLMSILRKL